MKFLKAEEAFDLIGQIGRIQILYIVIITSTHVFTAFHMIHNIFAGLEPHFTCYPISPAFVSRARRNDGTHNTSAVNLPTSENMIQSSVSRVINATTNSSDENLMKNSSKSNLGNVMVFNNPANPVIAKDSPSLRDKCPDNVAAKCRLVFDEGYKSFAQEWGLVCDEKYRVAVVQSVWMTGVMAGALFLAGVADAYGRINTLVISLIGTIAFDGLAGFAWTFSSYVFLRFIGGMMCAVVILCSFVLSQELVGGSRRSFAALLCSCAFSIGIALLALVAANVSNWRTLSLFSACFGIIFLVLPFIVPESPVWLLIKGREEEARGVFTLIARRNGTSGALPSQWKLVMNDEESTISVDSFADEDGKVTPTKKWLNDQKKKHKNLKKVIEQVDEKSSGIRGLLSHLYVVKILIIQIYSWFTNSAVYYGLTLAASDLGSNVYTSTALNGLVELPSTFIVMVIIDRIGRKPTLVAFMILGGVSCLLIPICGLLFTSPTIVTLLALLGKLCISASFAAAYIHSGEIFPTCVRNTGMGIVSVAARIGGVVCPFILMLGDIRTNLQFAVLGVIAFTAGVFNMILPETLGRPAPQTIRDMLSLQNSHQELPPQQHRYTRLKEEDLEDPFTDEEDVVEMDRT